MHATGLDEVVLVAGEERVHRAAARVEQEVRVLALRHAAPVLHVVGDDVAFEDDHLIEVGRDGSRRAHTGDASAEHYRLLTQAHLPTFPGHTVIRSVNDV